MEPDSRSFSCKVYGEPRSRTSKNPHHGVQFASSVLQIGASDGEVCAVQCGSRDEEQLVLAVPELVLFTCGGSRR